MRASFILKALKKMDFRSRMADIKRVAKKTGRSTISILFDLLGCVIKYGAGPVDYCLFEFYDKTPEQRKTYLTREESNRIVRTYNDPAFSPLVGDKELFCQHFGKFTGRDWLSLENVTAEALAEFCQGKDRVMYKPTKSSCGRGIELLDLSQWSQDDLYQHLLQKGGGLLDALVIQHPLMSSLNPSSVNTIRVVTIRKDNVTTPLCAFVRMGTGSRSVDNLNSNGIAAKVEMADGTIRLPAANKEGLLFDKHPDTNTQIVGFQVPHWDKVLELVIAASEVVPQVRYIGWDVAVRENDAVLIEGNPYPGHDLMQLPAYTPDKIGARALLEPYL